MKMDIQLVFKNDIELNNEDILIIPTWQKSMVSLLHCNEGVYKEMDRLYLNFKDWISRIKEDINKDG